MNRPIGSIMFNRFSKLRFAACALLLFISIAGQGVLYQANCQIPKPQPAPPSASKRSGQTKPPAAKPQGEDQKTAKESADKISSQEKEKQARLIIESALAASRKISPVEYAILAQVEAATLLWESDRDRAYAEIKNAFDRLRELTPEKDDSPSKAARKERSRLRSSILRKIARFRPDLIKELTTASEAAQSVEWSEESQAMVIVAYEEVDRNPALAADLIQQSLSYGMSAGLADFFSRLTQKDKLLAEQHARRLLAHLRNSSVSPLILANFGNFILRDKEVSAGLKDYYFESFAARLRRDLRPGLTMSDLEDLLNAARFAARRARGYPRWEAEFDQINSEFEALLKSLSLSAPSAAPARSIDMSSHSAAASGDTAEIEKSASRADSLINSEARDREYAALAASAAQKADLRLAQDLLSKIEDDALRRRASVRVYSPLVRKALSEFDYAQARAFALNITDPLGRSLVADHIARAMSGANEEKQLVKEFYAAVLSHLRRDPPTQDAARGYLILARSLLSFDAEASFEAMDWAVYVLNKSETSRPFASGASEDISMWVRRDTPLLGVEDALDLTEMIGPAFREMSRRDFNRSQSQALGISSPGLSLLAQLGTARGALDDVKSFREKKSKQADR
jgi:hypothetical protein